MTKSKYPNGRISRDEADVACQALLRAADNAGLKSERTPTAVWCRNKSKLLQLLQSGMPVTEIIAGVRHRTIRLD